MWISQLKREKHTLTLWVAHLIQACIKVSPFKGYMQTKGEWVCALFCYFVVHKGALKVF